MSSTCEWFALCGHTATVLVCHPALGDIPVCERCRARFDLTAVSIITPKENDR